jgi:hypothetical protein
VVWFSINDKQVLICVGFWAAFASTTVSGCLFVLLYIEANYNTGRMGGSQNGVDKPDISVGLEVCYDQYLGGHSDCRV